METETTDKNIKKPLLITLLVLVVMVAVGYGVYAYQQNKIAELNKQIAELKKESEDANVDEEPAEEATDTYTVPAGYLEYTVTNPDFSFAYPKTIGSLKLTTENLNAAQYKGQGVKGTSITISPTANNDNSFGVLTASVDYAPFGNDDPLAVFTLQGYTKTGATYKVPLSGDNIISDEKDFEVIKTRSGEEAVVFRVQNQGDDTSYTAIGMVNLPSSTGYKAIGITANSISELKSILATVKVGK